jgi:hypothetical protein
VSTTEELLGRNSSGSGLGNREYGSGDPLCWPRNTLYPQNLALTSLASGGRSVNAEGLRGIAFRTAINSKQHDKVRRKLHTGHFMRLNSWRAVWDMAILIPKVILLLREIFMA